MTLEEKKQLHAELLAKHRRVFEDHVDMWKQAQRALTRHAEMMFELGEMKAELVQLAVEIAKESDATTGKLSKTGQG